MCLALLQNLVFKMCTVLRKFVYIHLTEMLWLQLSFTCWTRRNCSAKRCSFTTEFPKHCHLWFCLGVSKLYQPSGTKEIKAALQSIWRKSGCSYPREYCICQERGTEKEFPLVAVEKKTRLILTAILQLVLMSNMHSMTLFISTTREMTGMQWAMWVAQLPDSGAAVLEYAKEQRFHELSPQQSTSSLCVTF